MYPQPSQPGPNADPQASGRPTPPPGVAWQEPTPTPAPTTAAWQAPPATGAWQAPTAPPAPGPAWQAPTPLPASQAWQEQTAAPTSPAWQPPGTPLPPAAPQPSAGSPRPRRVTVAAVVAGLLLLVLVVNGLAVLTVRGQQQGETSRLDRELAAHRQTQQKAREDLEAQFRQADLRGKLQTVRTRDAAATAALIAWGTNGQPLSGLKDIRQARNACAEAVIDYNATAARFPTYLLAGLPARINLSDEATDCDR